MTTTTSAPFADLAAALRGDLVTPGDADYDAARAVYNGMIDKRPAAVARCRDAADVIAAIAFARVHGLEIAVRGGGHHAAGFGTWDDALVVDLSPMRSVTVDPAQRTVRVDGGASWGDVDHATVAFGLATPSGFLASTGVAGLALGGGIGYLSRRFGLTVDNLFSFSADVALADGRYVTASATSHPDLYWALRGGGGNFGVVTSFTFRCHPIGENGTVVGGPVLYDIADAPDVMRWYRELIPALPEELSGWLGLITIPPAPPFPDQLWGRKACVDRVVLHRPARPGRGHTRPDPGSSGRRWSWACTRCRSRRCSRRSTRSTRPVSGCTPRRRAAPTSTSSWTRAPTGSAPPTATTSSG